MSEPKRDEITEHVGRAEKLRLQLLAAEGNSEHENLTKAVEALAGFGGGHDPCQTFMDQARADIKAHDYKDAAKVLVKYTECENRRLRIPDRQPER
jgi:hypothetical protein